MSWVLIEKGYNSSSLSTYFIMNIFESFNIHPIVVHFPVAMLMAYSIIEIISLFSQKRAAKLYTTKTIILWIGAVWGFMALQTGEWTQEFLWISGDLVHTHEEYADKTFFVYAIITVYYIIKTMYIQQIWGKYWVNNIQAYHSQLTSFFASSVTQVIVTLIAIVWMGLLTITGALGGAIAHGTNNGDPVSDWAVANLVANQSWEITSTNYLDQSNDMPYKDLDPSEYPDNNNTPDITGVVLVTPPATDNSLPQNDSILTPYTMEDVALHKDMASCRTAIDGVIYDLTAWIDQHPWWDRNILRLCGIDGSALFNGQHGGQALQVSILAGFEIWILK